MIALLLLVAFIAGFAAFVRAENQRTFWEVIRALHNHETH